MRQFLIGPRERKAVDGWASQSIGPDLALSYCPTLPLEEVRQGLRLGLAVSSDDSDDPEDWCGRYVLIADGLLQLDTAGTLGVFYRLVEQELWVSSSPELLRAIPPELPDPESELEWGVEGREWFPPPESGLAQVGRLLPSQRLRLTDGRVEPRWVLPPVPQETTISEIEVRLRRIVLELSRLGPLWVGLTAGMDSRLILAACAAEGVAPVTFTFDRGADAKYALTRGDAEIPAQLAAAIGLQHHLIAPSGYDAEAAALFDRHTCFHSADADRYEVSHHQWAKIPANAIVLAGCVLEAVRGYYHLHQPPIPATWWDWIERTPTEVDWRDRLYLEQRVGGWLSSVEQGVDLTGRRSIYPANCGRLLSDILALPEETRTGGFYQGLLVRRMAPKLAAVPVNPLPLRERAKGRWNRERGLIRHHGGLASYLSSRTHTFAKRARCVATRAGIGLMSTAALADVPAFG